MNKIALITTLLFSSALIACTNPNGTVSDQSVGTVVGGVGGAVVGSAFGGGTGRLLATGAGAVGGALVGNSVGKSMDRNNGNQ